MFNRKVREESPAQRAQAALGSLQKTYARFAVKLLMFSKSEMMQHSTTRLT